MTEDGVDPDVTALRDAYDWYLQPVVNPDGYDYTWTTVTTYIRICLSAVAKVNMNIEQKQYNMLNSINADQGVLK